MTSYAVASSSTQLPSGSKNNWFFSKAEMQNSQSVREGMSEEEELRQRQMATRFIQDMVDKINETYKESRSKISQLCMCSASIHINRFFYFHSFRFFDYRDVAAACLFLAGKSEESPRKLEHITRAWWAKKFPHHPFFPTPQHAADAAALIVQLENVVLQTIAFDLKIELPHPIVLRIMQGSIGQAANDHGNKRLTECAYFFATDVLCVTSWGIRYSAAAIAVCCVNIVCAWCSHEIPPGPNGAPWFAATDPSMTQAILDEMSAEFLKIYWSVRGRLAIHKFCVAPPRSQAEPEPERIHVQPRHEVPLLPPPPPPPSFARKVDYAEYKERSRSTPSGGDKGPSVLERKSFIPNIAHASKTTHLPTLSLPGMEPIHAQPHSERTDSSLTNGRKDDKREDERRRDKDRKTEERPEDRKRRKEEHERKKREHEKMSGHSRDAHGPSTIKKPRPDSLSSHFVSGSGSIVNGHKSDDHPPRKPSHTAPPTSRSPPRKPLSEHIQPPAPLSPPPPPPPMFTAQELEDGEVE